MQAACNRPEFLPQSILRLGVEARAESARVRGLVIGQPALRGLAIIDWCQDGWFTAQWFAGQWRGAVRTTAVWRNQPTMFHRDHTPECQVFRENVHPCRRRRSTRAGSRYFWQYSRSARSAVVREFGSIFGQQTPGFAVVFVFVTVLMDGGDRAEGYGLFDRGSEQNGGRDEVPDLLRDHVAGEQVKVSDGVGLGDQIVAAEL